MPVILFLKHIFDVLHFERGPVPTESSPAVMSAQPPGKLALAAEAVRGLLIH